MRWRSTTEPSAAPVTNVRSRIEEPIERIALPCDSNSCAFTISRSASGRGRARNQADTPPFASPTITVWAPSPHSTAVRGTEPTGVASVSWADPPERSQW